MTHFLKLRGLPYAATERDIMTFLDGLPLWNETGILITLNDDGRPSGECLVKLDNEIGLNDLRAYNGKYMGTRFIEVFPATQKDWFAEEMRLKMSDMTYVRLRGLPYDVTKEDIYIFFTRLMISRDGVGLLVGPDDVPTGEAFVQFITREDANLAFQRHNQCIRSRYIEVYKSSLTEVYRAMEKQYEINREEILKRSMHHTGNNYPPKFNPEPYKNTVMNTYYADGYAQNKGTQGPMRRNREPKIRAAPYAAKSAHSNVKVETQNIGEFLGPLSIHMRGLPYSATERDVQDFFAPVQVSEVKIHYGPDGKASGEAEADFFTEEDAMKAMEKDRCKMSWRYIELFRGSATGQVF